MLIRSLLWRTLTTSACFTVLLTGCSHQDAQPQPERPNTLGCLQHMVPELARHPTIVDAVAAYNLASNVDITDEAWARLPEDAQQVQMIKNTPAAKLIARAVEQTSWQGEGFLMGADGGLVAVTGKTSDYWQDDEPQFYQALELAPGETYLEQQVVDQSSAMMLIKVASPVYNPATNQPIGVLMVGFDQFVVEFHQPCNHWPELHQNKTS